VCAGRRDRCDAKPILPPRNVIRPRFRATDGISASRSDHEPRFRREFDSAARWHFSLSLSLPAICPAIAKPRLRLGPALSRLRAVAHQVLRDVPLVAAPLVRIPGPSSSAQNTTRRRILASVLEIPLRKNGAFRREMALMFHNDFAALRALSLSRGLFSLFFPPSSLFFRLRRISNSRSRSACSNVRSCVKLRSGERMDGRPATFQKSRPRRI
jgi:hypothetical protein